MIKSEKAVSEVIGMALVLSIMILVIGSIMLVGMPIIESSKDNAKMDVAMDSFLSLQNDIEEVVRGPVWIKDPYNITNINKTGPSRVTEFELMGGTLSVLPNSTNVTCKPNCSATKVNNFTIIIPPSNITYEAGEEIISYESGAVIRKYETGMPLMVSDPLISIYDTGDDKNLTVVSIHAISINGTLSSTGGDGRSRVETRLRYYNQIREPQNSPSLYLNQTNITITSKYRGAWRAFFNKTLNETARLRYNPICPGYYFNETTTSLTVKIYGKDCTKEDILLSVYESGIDVKVK